MALVIGVSVGSRIDVGRVVVEVVAITQPNLIVLNVNDQDVVIHDNEQKEILPEVWVQTGIDPGNGSNRLVFTAPRSIKITNQKRNGHAHPR